MGCPRYPKGILSGIVLYPADSQNNFTYVVLAKSFAEPYLTKVELNYKLNVPIYSPFPPPGDSEGSWQLLSKPLIPITRGFDGSFIFPCTSCKFQGIGMGIEPRPKQSPYGICFQCGADLFVAATNLENDWAPKRLHSNAGYIPTKFSMPYEMTSDTSGYPKLQAVSGKKRKYKGKQD